MRVSELGGQDGMCLLDVLCCRMKFSQAHMCVNDSFAGRLKSDIKTERNAWTHGQTHNGHHSLPRGITRMATCRHHHVCSAAVALGNVPVCLRLCAHICPLCVSHQGINTQSAVSHGDSRSFTAANQRQWAHLATPFTLQMAHKLCPFITPVNTHSCILFKLPMQWSVEPQPVICIYGKQAGIPTPEIKTRYYHCLTKANTTWISKIEFFLKGELLGLQEGS